VVKVLENIKRRILENKFIKDTSWNSFGMFSYYACQWLITIAVVWLSDDLRNAGYLNLAMSVTNFFAAIALYNIRYFQVSDLKMEYSDSDYVAARVLTCVASIVICAVLIFAIEFSPIQRVIILIYMFFRANESFLDVLHGIDQKNGRMDYVGISAFIRGTSMLAAFTVFMWLFNLAIAVTGVAVFNIAVGLIYDLPRTKKLANFVKFTWKRVFSLLKRCFPLMLVLFIITMIGSFTRYSIERVHGTEALGIYASVTVPTLIVQIASFPMMAPLTNLFAASIKQGDKKRFLRILLYSSAVITGIILFFTTASLFIGEWGLKLLYGDILTQYHYLLPGAFIVSGLVSYIWLMNIIFSATRDLKGILAGNIIGAIICLAAAGYFLARYDLIGANYVMIISQGAVVLFLLVRLFWYIKSKPELFEQRTDDLEEPESAS